MFPFSFLTASSQPLKPLSSRLLADEKLPSAPVSQPPFSSQPQKQPASQPLPKSVPRSKSQVQQRLDTLAKRVSAPAVSRRNRHQQMKQSMTASWLPLPTPDLSSLIERFGGTEVQCPADSRGVYADLTVGEYRLRLNALVWSEAVPDGLVEDSELSLLLVLSPMGQSYLPIGTELTITENNLLHSGQNLRWTGQPTCLYTQVFGDWEKKFTVGVLLPNALPKMLPPLTFER